LLVAGWTKVSSPKASVPKNSRELSTKTFIMLTNLCKADYRFS
jgi:hypothetical protein